MIVLKFGGTSVGNAARMQQVLDIVWAQRERAPLLISSAMARVTDTLLRIGQAAQNGDESTVQTELEFLNRLHFETLDELAKGEVLQQSRKELEKLFEELSSLLRGLVLIQEVSERSQDALVSFGERMSTLLLWTAARNRGMSVELIDSRSCVITDDSFGSANLLRDASFKAIRETIKAEAGKVIVGQGFIASTTNNITTTLGRGGSDYSATIFGAALLAEEVQIWTDVAGIMTTDPRLIPSARPIAEISYEEAAELAYFGAKVIHPSTIQPAVEAGIPVLVKSTMEPEAQGTRIHRTRASGGIQAIASKKGITVITVKSSRMLNAYGFLQAIFSVFARQGVPVDLVTTSEVSVSVTVDQHSKLPDILKELSAFSQVEAQPDHAILSLVGSRLWKDGSLTAKVFTALVGLPVRMISLGGSDINLSLVLPQASLDEAVKRLHGELLE